MRSIPARALSALCVSIVTAGCGLPVLDLRDDADLHHASFQDKLASGAPTNEFVACLRQPYDERRPMFRSTDPSEGLSSERPLMEGGMSSDGYLSPIHALIQELRGLRQPASLSALEDLVGEWTSGSRRRLDLGKLKHVVDVIQGWHTYFSFDEDELSRHSSRFARMLLTYNKAYFGDLSYRAKSGSTGTGPRGIVKVTSQGFIDRSGNAFVFPGVSAAAEIDGGLDSPVRASASMVDSQRVSADLTRIFLEAFFDTAFRVPAVQGATALRVAPSHQEFSYPEFDADHPAIPVEALARVTRDSLRAEAAVVSMVGKTVRGGSVFGTQNETLAATLETAAGVIAKKLVEHEGFCYFEVIAGQPASSVLTN